MLLFLVDLARNFRFAGEDDAGNVYGGGTLEWLPTGLYSARSHPGRHEPRAAVGRPEARRRRRGRAATSCPTRATGRRETLITSPLRAEPQYLQIMPGPSGWPLLAAVFTAGFFLLLTVKAYWRRR